MKFLTRIEEIYLIAIWRLGENAYGVTIKNEIRNISGKATSYGALYFALDQIHKKGYVNRIQGEPTPVRGGCGKTFYSLTRQGKEALKQTYELQKSIWKDISILNFEESNE